MSPNQQNNENKKKAVFNWSFAEYNQTERGKLWYALFFSALGLMMVYAVATINFLFGVIIVMGGIVLMIRQKNIPNKVSLSLNESGVEIDGKHFDFSEFADFYILYQPPELKNLYLNFKSVVKPRLIIPLEDQNPLAIRELLIAYLKEDLDKEEEPLSEVFRKTFKL